MCVSVVSVCVWCECACGVSARVVCVCGGFECVCGLFL